MVDSPHDKFKLIFYESISYDTIHTYIPDMIRKFGTDFQCNPFQIYPLNVAEIHDYYHPNLVPSANVVWS